MHANELLGCTVSELMRHIESRFMPGMTWENYAARGWHIDHIVPCSSFNLADATQAARCFHYTNLQPLWWKDNITKGNRILAP
jgi:hypothetical protein